MCLRCLVWLQDRGRDVGETGPRGDGKVGVATEGHSVAVDTEAAAELVAVADRHLRRRHHHHPQQQQQEGIAVADFDKEGTMVAAEWIQDSSEEAIQ